MLIEQPAVAAAAAAAGSRLLHGAALGRQHLFVALRLLMPLWQLPRSAPSCQLSRLLTQQPPTLTFACGQTLQGTKASASVQ